MKILIIAETYPNPKINYSNDFVHQRNKTYVNSGMDVTVAVRNSENHSYTIDKINVVPCSSLSNIENLIKKEAPAAIGIHFYSSEYLKLLKMFGGKVLIWIHGHEAINWYRRFYDYSFLDIIKHLPGLLFLLIKRKYSWNRINKLSRSNNRITFIFVSKWMKKVTEIDNFVKFKNYKIIPNGIDTTRFKFVQKTELDRLNIISIRPFNSKKYANDITISTILELSKRSFFNNLKFTVIGKGVLFNELTQKVSHFKNVKLINGFFSNEEIPLKHFQNGVFLCPTRQDAQGVSMCEAMSSGLVPVTSNNTAIPEFVEDKHSGFLNTNNPVNFADSIEFLLKNPKIFLKISKNASSSIEKICSSKIVAKLELELFKD